MPTYIGEYNAGDFFRFPTSSDKKTEIKGDRFIYETNKFFLFFRPLF